MIVYSSYGKMWPSGAIAEIERLRAALERQLEAHNYAEVLEIARKALANEEEGK